MASNIYSNQISKKDSQNLYQLINSNISRFSHYFPITVKSCQTESSTLEYLNSLLKDVEDKEQIIWRIYDELKLIGIIFVKNIDWRIPKAELAYMIDADYGQRGIITSELTIIINYCFEELKFYKLFCRVSPKNIASNKVAQHCGFELEGTLKGEFRIADGTIEDIAYYGKWSAPN